MNSPHPVPDDTLVAFTYAYGEHHIRRSEASRFATAYGDLPAWRALPLEQRLSSPIWAKPMICWAVLTRRLEIDVDYVIACRSRWGNMARRLFPDEHARFTAATDELGFCAQETRVQWSMLIKTIAAVPTATTPLAFDDPTFQEAADRALEAVRRHRRSLPKSFSTPMFGLHATLFHLGALQQPPRKREGKPASRASRWEPLETAVPLLAATMLRYLDQIALSLRPGTVGQADTSLRAFAGWLTDHHPEVDTVPAIRRVHVEGYKIWLHRQDGYQGRKFSAATITHRLGDLRTFLDRITEWGWPDAPDRPLIFLGDFPRPDRPLPRFLDDGAAAKLLAAARAHPDPFARLAVEMLARTGLRTGELLDLTIDAVVQIGAHHWLRVPVGKLHTDRYIPLHPAIKTLLDDWIAKRPDTLRTNLLFIDRGRRIPRSRLQHAVADCAHRAGLGHVTPHQLRHTLATQAINRGMSLEAIASLLGHQSLTMTMVYARIADRTVADEYFNVTEQVEALYQRPHQLPAEVEGDNMRRLRTETERRLLGNGWCTRPREVVCRYETICETCSFFATDIEFRPTLQAQHDDATDRGQHERVALYQNLLTRLDDQTA